MVLIENLGTFYYPEGTHSMTINLLFNVFYLFILHLLQTMSGSVGKETVLLTVLPVTAVMCLFLICCNFSFDDNVGFSQL